MIFEPTTKCRFLRTVYGLLLFTHNALAMVFSIVITAAFITGRISTVTVTAWSGIMRIARYKTTQQS